MKESNELFELCKQVYEATGWDDLADDHDWFTERGVIGYKRNGIAPLYTSDYLLEKLPPGLDLFKRPTSYAAIGPGVDPSVYQSDTPLKALLKLTIKLHEEGIL